MIRTIIFIAFIMLLVTIILVTIGASIKEENEREIDERVRLQQELEEDLFYLRLARAERERLRQRKIAQECLDKKRKECKK